MLLLHTRVFARAYATVRRWHVICVTGAHAGTWCCAVCVAVALLLRLLHTSVTHSETHTLAMVALRSCITGA